MQKLIVLFVVATAILSCNVYAKKKTVPKGYKMVWNDEFDGEKLDVTKWAYRTDNKHRSIQRKENIEIKDGALVLNLKVFKEPVEGKLASGAGIVTQRRFKYGYYEVRAKLGDGIDDDNDGRKDEGWHHSFWAMAASVDTEKNEVNTTYPGIRRTEIDCYENPTEHKWDKHQFGLNNFTQHIIVWKEDGKEWGRLPKQPGDLTQMGDDFNASDWHVYGFEWTEDVVNFYVDGKLTKVAEYPKDKFVHDDINVWLTAIATNWNKPDQEQSQAQYDYFRFYEKKK